MRRRSASVAVVIVATLVASLLIGRPALGVDASPSSQAVPSEATSTASPTPSLSPSPSPAPTSSSTPTPSATASPSATTGSSDGSTLRYVVLTQNEAATDDLKRRAAEFGASIDRTYEGAVDGFAVRLTPADAARLAIVDGVAVIAPDLRMSVGAPGAAVRTNAGCTANSLPRADDASSAAVSIGFPVNWFGTSYSSLFVSNNGGVVLNDGGSSSIGYRDIDLATTTRPLILPLFTDMDTRNLATTPVSYGQITDLDGNADVDAFCVNWVNTGEFDSTTAKFSAQLVIIDQGSGNVDIEFNYDSVLAPTSVTNGGFVIGYADPKNRSNTWSLVTAADSTAPYVDNGASQLRGHVDAVGAVEGRFVKQIRPGAGPTATASPSPTPSPTATSSCSDSVPAGTQGCAPWNLDRLDVRTRTYDQRFTPAGTGSGVVVYVVDTGIYNGTTSTHTEFTGRIGAAQMDEVDNDTVPQDCNGHGTHVAGTVAGTTYGVAKQATLVGVRVLDCDGSGWSSDVIAGLNWIATNHSTNYPGRRAVVNMSLGGSASKPLDDAVTQVIAAGIPVVVAAGNDAADASLDSPARVASAITVAASDRNDARAWFSNIGSAVDLFAPGVDVVSAGISSTTASTVFSGTSMAAPHVAGAVAVYLALNGSATPAQVSTAIVGAATPDVITSPGTGTPNRLLYARSFEAYSSGGTDSGSSNGGSSSGGSSGGGSSGGGSSGGSSGDSSGGGGALQEITSLRPASGPLAGGNLVSIIGYGFTGASSVTFGGKAARYRVVNDAHVEVIMPPGDRPGSVDVAVVLSPERGRAFAGGGYVYTNQDVSAAAPSVASPAAPSSSPTVTAPASAATLRIARPAAVTVARNGLVTVKVAVPKTFAGRPVALTRKGRTVATGTVTATGVVALRSKKIVTGFYRLTTVKGVKATSPAFAVRVRR